MPLSWNEIRAKASQFSKDWKSASDERSQGQEFWIAFFDIFGIKKPRIASFEHAVKKHGGSQGFIDLFWPGMLLVEHKSRGKNLERAHDQAMDYFPGLKERDLLLECCALDWSAISPAIFGAMFQSIMDAKARRNVGAHYTSEENILKLIKPLFLDDLRAEFHKVKGNRNRLFEFHKKLRTLSFLDPARGCGNFLVITYRELRQLELEVLRAAYGSGQQVLDVHQLLRVDVDQFHGIEIEEFPAQIAQVALWLIDHQMNLRVSDEFGAYCARIPLKATPHIVNGNALRIDWAEVIPPERCSYVLGNPPFVGAMVISDSQREDMARVFADLKGYGVLEPRVSRQVCCGRRCSIGSGCASTSRTGRSAGRTRRAA